MRSTKKLWLLLNQQYDIVPARFVLVQPAAKVTQAVAYSILTVFAEADGAGIGAGAAVGSKIIFGTAAGSGLGDASIVGLIFALVVGSGVGSGSATGTRIVLGTSMSSGQGRGQGSGKVNFSRVPTETILLKDRVAESIEVFA